MSRRSPRRPNPQRPYEAFHITRIAPFGPVRRGPARFGFSFKADGRIAVVAAELTCELGTVRRMIAPGAAGLGEQRGAGALTLDLGRLPRGPARLSLALVDADGRVGEAASVDFDVPCGEPTDPGTIRFSPLAASMSRPLGADLVHARFRVSGGPAPGSVLFVSVALPDGFTETLDIAAPGDATEMTFFSFGSSHPPGRYDLTARLVGPGGDIGEPAKASIELLEGGKPKGPSIASIATGKDGRIRVRGAGFSGKDVTALVGHLPAAILEAGERELIIEPPDLDEPSPVFVATPWGEARSAEPWRPPVRVAVVPETFTLAEGDTFSLTALVSGTSDKRVLWSIQGKRKQSPARIDETGRVTASFPGKAVEFSVTARSAADPNAVAAARGTIGPRPDGLRGPATVGVLGGAVRSRDGGAVLRLPPGALSAPRRMSIETVTPRLGRTRSGPLVAGEVALTPVGLKLGKEATVELNLPVALPPGSKVPVRVRRRGGKQWDVLDWDGVVGLNGNTFSVDVREVPNRLQAVIEVDWRHTFPRDNRTAAPIIFSIAPNQVDEGATVAILVTGVNFVPGRTAVELRKPDGTVEQRVELRGLAITADGRRLGLSLKAGVMTDLAEGQGIPLTLRVTTPAGTVDGSIAILGHNELDVLTGSRTLAVSGRFSRMDVEPGARLNIAGTFPPVRIECFERAYLRSFFDAQSGVVVLAGDGGRPAPGSAGGAGGPGGPGTGPAALGSGGAGGKGATGMSGTGAVGTAGRGSATLTPAGAGGIGGRPGGFGIFPHAGGTGGDGSAGRRTAFSFPDEAFEPGPGGGGGGGGGGEGMIFQNTGGGGGGGGAGGGAVSIAAGEELTMQGDVVAAGGDGALGAYPLDVVSPREANLIQAGPGGGGGGGAGGYIELHGVRHWSGAALAVGGRNGTAPRYGAPIANPLTARQMLFTRPESGAIWVGGDTPLLRGIAGKWPDLDYVYNPLVTVPEVDIRAPDADVVRVDAGPLQRREFAVPTDPGSHFRVTITLFELFNEVRSERSWNTAPAPPLVCAAIRRRTLLYLPGTIPAFEFACAIAPSSATVPTERSLTLVATVTARPTTSLQWDVYGGTANGTVRQTPAGAIYTAPTTAPSSAVAVRAAATLDPNRFEDAVVTVVPGIALAASAATGVPANTAIASANVGQSIGIGIPGAVFAQTGEAFAVNQDVEFEVFDAPNRFTTRRAAVQSLTGVGMQALSVRVPENATPVHSVRVAGHGSARLQIVPVITSIEPHPTSFPNIFINGSGFDGRSVEVVFITGALAPAQILSVRPDRIEVAVRPAPGSEVRVRTPGGTSAGFVMP